MPISLLFKFFLRLCLVIHLILQKPVSFDQQQVRMLYKDVHKKLIMYAQRTIFCSLKMSSSILIMQSRIAFKSSQAFLRFLLSEDKHEMHIKVYW